MDNDVDIYEGDILQDVNKALYKVEWEGDGWACFEFSPVFWAWTFGSLFSGSSLKVIGNVFDNPELLEVQKNEH